MVTGEFTATELAAAVQAAMVITPNRVRLHSGGVSVHHPALQRNDGWQDNFQIGCRSGVEHQKTGAGVTDAIQNHRA